MNSYTRSIYLILVLLLTGFMIINPELTVNASLDGLNLWFNVVFPALFPFFVAAELLVQLGFVHFLGVLLEPIMRPLFRLPGSASFVVAMGFTSGFPIGAVLTKNLYARKMLDGNEAERLVSFTNNSSPLFMLGAVAVGMFKLPVLAGYVIAVSHYLANLSVGLLWGRLAPSRYGLAAAHRKRSLLRSALYQLFTAHREQQIGIGAMLGESIRKSINNILAVGGFIVIFSAITQMLGAWGVIDFMARCLQQMGALAHLSYSLACGISTGVFEMTLGARAIAASESSLIQQLTATGIVLAWSGLSVIAQVMSMVAGVPVRFSFYVLSRFIQMILAAVYTIVGYHLFLVERIAGFTLTGPLMETTSYPELLVSVYVWPLAIAFLTLLLLSLLSTAIHRSSHPSRR